VTLPANVTGGASSTVYNADNAQTKFNGTALNYDANGNLTSDGTNTYTWDARNHLTAISGGSAATFTYDGFGWRVKKVIGGTTTQFLYDGLNPVQELNGKHNAAAIANLLTGLGVDEYFTRTDSATSTFLADALGSTVGLVGSGGSISTNYTYQSTLRLHYGRRLRQRKFVPVHRPRERRDGAVLLPRSLLQPDIPEIHRSGPARLRRR
jgi:hypothetical protein